MINFSLELMFLPQVRRKISEVMIVQNGDLPATTTHQMMMRLFRDNLINGCTTNLRFADHLELVEEGQGAVNGCPVQGGRLRVDAFIDLVDTGVPPHCTERIQNEFALGGEAITKIADFLAVV